MSLKKPWNQKQKGNLYVLGDSLCDTGALVGGGTAFFRHLKMTREISTVPPFYQNSFSNGPVAVQIIADHFGIVLKPAWRFSLLGVSEQQIGNNYAVGGASASINDSFSFNAFLLNHFTFDNQLTALLTQHQLQPDDIIFVTFGGNDLFNALKKNSSNEQEAALAKAILAIKTGLEKLIAANAKHIILVNVPDMSKLPLFKDKSDNKKQAHHLCQKFNHELLKISKLIDNKHEIIINFDLVKCLAQAMTLFKKNYSHKNVSDGATRTDWREVIINGKIVSHFNAGVNNDNINDYFFFDEIHPSAWVHNFIAQQLIKIISDDNNNKENKKLPS